MYITVGLCYARSCVLTSYTSINEYDDDDASARPPCMPDEHDMCHTV